MAPLDTNISQKDANFEPATTAAGFLSIFFWLGLSAMIGRVILCMVPFSVSNNKITAAKNSNLKKTHRVEPRSDGNSTVSMAWNNDQSDTTSDRELHCVFVASTYAWFLSYFDGEGKRKKHWDHEQRKCRDFQQMLCTLRNIRAQREAKRKTSSLGHSSGANEEKNMKRKVRIVLPQEEDSECREPVKAFPWKCDEPSSRLGPFDGVAKHSWTIAQLLRYKSISDYKEQRRKQRWDKEVKRYRPLQQQLLSLQVIRAQRESLGYTKGLASRPREIDVVDVNKFPWKDG